MWKYESPIGNMYILIHPGTSRYTVKFNNQYFGSYSTPQKAAGDVACFCIGYDDWDSLDGSISDYPSDLSDWERL